MSDTVPSIGETISTARRRDNRAQLLALANPLPALRQRDVRHRAGQLRAKSSMPTRTRFVLSLNAQVCPG
jgi:hypothetical protein